MDTQMDDDITMFDETDYSTWKIEMKGYLKEKGVGVWKEAIGGSIPSKNKLKFTFQKEEKKNDSLSFKTIFNGLSSMGQCNYAKDLWLKLEKVYQDKIKYTKDNSTKENEGKNSPKYFGYNTPSEVEFSLTNEEDDIKEVCIEFENDEEEYLLKLTDKVLSELYDVIYEIGNSSTYFEYLEKYTKEILETYPRHTMEINKILMKQEEEIKKLKNDITSQVEETKKVDDEIIKSLEVNVNLKK
jgi:hypothetical protein